MNDHLSGKELFIRFTAPAFRKPLSFYVFSYFPFGFEGRMWDLIVSVPDHCLSFYFECDIFYKIRTMFGIISYIYILGVFTEKPYIKPLERNVVYITIITLNHATSHGFK